jgi:triacylglycerol lipase
LDAIMVRSSSAGRRVHIVLVPGFGGFDALGQLEYYAGVTPQFRSWKGSDGNGHDDAVLHYFDNFPTAAVVTRATRLLNYLAKRIARGEFLVDDWLALVGHSTGGLDIRRLLWDLVASSNQKYGVDGTHDSEFAVAAKDILRLIKRVVFLSVPQWGTNIADWVRTYALWRPLVVAELRASVAASQLPFLDKVEDWVSSRAAGVTKIELLYAVEDVLRETEAPQCKDPMLTALAQEAASELALWLRHMASDFGAIDDLAAQGPARDRRSPAHFTRRMRDHEISNWKEFGIQTRSYATLGSRPFRFDHGRPAPRLDVLNLLTYPECTQSEVPSPRTDIMYRCFYRACAGGPFTFPDPNNLPKPQPFVVASERQRPIELWDNDGIVNTASMLWPNGDDTLLVEGDHMDIVGHYQLVPASSEESGRKYRAYDLLRSDSEFLDPAFERVWNNVFDFCAGRATSNPNPRGASVARKLRGSRPPSAAKR